MTETVKIPVGVLHDNLQTQISASDEVLKIVTKLTEMARDNQNASVTPAIAPYLERLARVSENLTRSANSAAKIAADRYGQD